MRQYSIIKLLFCMSLFAGFCFSQSKCFSDATNVVTDGKHTEAQKKALGVTDAKQGVDSKELAVSDFNHKAKNAYRSPFLATSSIIEMFDDNDKFLGIVLITRCNSPLGKAIPGGHVEYGDSLEQTVVREMKEETGLDIYDIKQFHAYSKPNRDPRKHMIDIVFVSKAKGTPKGNTDAASAFIVELDKLPWNELVFDHADIVRDYISWRNGDSSKQVCSTL